MLLTDWMTPVGDQGHLGSCTGWGSTANRELLAQERLAPLFAYALAKYLDGRPDLEGSWQYFCFEGFVRFGHLREADYPYTDRPAGLPVEPYLAQAATFQSEGFADVLLDPADMHLQPLLLKAILAGRLNDTLGPQPVSTSVAVYASWDAASTALYGLVTLPLEGERLLGGHALCIAGYIDAMDPDGLYGMDYFVVKNSWGPRWAAENPLGLPGYALIPAAYFTQPSLHWEALVCLAEPSPVRTNGAGWLALLRAAWAADLLTPPVAVGACGTPGL
jgi:C1A family cysteine protease